MALSVGLLRRLKSRSTPLSVRPEIHRGADARSRCAVDPLRQPALESQPLECGGDIPAVEALADIDRQAFAGEEQDHREAIPEPPTPPRQLAHALVQRGQLILSAACGNSPRPRRLEHATHAPRR